MNVIIVTIVLAQVVLAKDIARDHLCALHGRHWLYELALVYWVPVETDYTPCALGSDTVYIFSLVADAVSFTHLFIGR